MTYDSNTLKKDLVYSSIKITRTNVETKGYTGFLLPLLENNTYSIVIDYSTMHTVKKGWIDDALQVLSVPQTVYACDTYANSTIAMGCFALPSLMLRSLWTNTEFRLSDMEAIQRVSLAVQCKYHAKLMNGHLLNNHSTYSGMNLLEGDCLKNLGVESMKCHSTRKEENTVAVYFTQYKRNYLKRQLESLFKSSIKINELLIYQGEQRQNYGLIVKNYPMCKHFWTTNWNNPFFLRFLIPFIVKSFYIINLDDDILLQRRTLESMLDVVKKYDAITSAQGRRVKKLDFNSPKLVQSVIMSSPKEYNTVDFLVICYAMKLEYAKVFWRYRYMIARNGEDIHISATNMMECQRRSMIRKKGPQTEFTSILDGAGASTKKNHFLHRGILVRTWIMSGYPIMNPKALVNFPSLTNETMSYFRSQIRYVDYVSDVCCPCTIVY